MRSQCVVKSSEKAKMRSGNDMEKQIVPPAGEGGRDGIGFDLIEAEAVRRSAFFQLT